MSKRTKVIVVAFILAVLLWATQWISADKRLQGILVVAILSYVLTAWSLFEDLKGVEWFTILILPVTYTMGAGLFNMFLPDSVPRLLGVHLGAEAALVTANFVHVMFWVGFATGFYFLGLTANIFSVAAVRTIQLLRAAHPAGFLITLVTALFWYHVIFSFKLPFWLVGVAVFIISSLLTLHGNWSMRPKEGIDKLVTRYSFGTSFVLAQVATALAFWPVKPLTAALSMVTALYVMLGLSQLHLAGRLFKNHIYEYLVVAAVVFGASIYLTHWR